MNGCFYDLATALAEKRIFSSLRASLISTLRGTIVDVGAGTGANFRHYAPQAQVIALEPDPSMAKRARARIAGSAAQIELRIADAESLRTFSSRSVDAVVMTFVLCTVDDPVSALRGAKRVLNADGTLVVIEHVRSPGGFGKVQDVIAPAWRATAGGCHLNRETAATLRLAGFDTAGLKTRTLPKVVPIREIVYGALRAEP